MSWLLRREVIAVVPPSDKTVASSAELNEYLSIAAFPLKITALPISMRGGNALNANVIQVMSPTQSPPPSPLISKAWLCVIAPPIKLNSSASSAL